MYQNSELFDLIVFVNIIIYDMILFEFSSNQIIFKKVNQSIINDRGIIENQAQPVHSSLWETVCRSVIPTPEHQAKCHAEYLRD